MYGDKVVIVKRLFLYWILLFDDVYLGFSEVILLV